MTLHPPASCTHSPEHCGFLTLLGQWLLAQGDRQITRALRCPRRSSYTPAFVTATPRGQQAVLTRSMRSLRFFSICCGGRRLIKSKAQSSCWSLCRDKESPWSQGGQGTQHTAPSSSRICVNTSKIHCIVVY